MTFDPFRGTSYSAEVVQQTAAQWATTGNFVLQSYQIGIETDTGKAKFGDGSSDWDTLDYWVPGGAPYKVYTALLTQTGTSAPTATVFSNIPIIVLPHQANQNWGFLDYLKRSAQYESEHIRLFANDIEMFRHYQGANDVHPIFE